MLKNFMLTLQWHFLLSKTARITELFLDVFPILVDLWLLCLFQAHGELHAEIIREDYSTESLHTC